MKKCAVCGNNFPDSYRFCPLDGAELELAANEVAKDSEALPFPRNDLLISVRTLLYSLGLLVLVGTFSFATVFLYQYWKPKYGGLVVKTTPPGATVFIDGKRAGVSPLTIGRMRSGGHQVKVVREGYKEFVQHVEVIPYATENLHSPLEPLVAHLTNEQLAEIESLRKKLDTAIKEDILLPPPEDYNAVLFANKILAIDPANAHALEVKGKLIENIRHSADVAYAREDWLQAENYYNKLALLLPNDISINERLADLASKIDASMKDRGQRIAEWTVRAEAAMKAGSLVPPEKDNALEALRNIQRLDKKNHFARDAMVRLKEMLQNRGDTKISGGDWQGARNEFKLVLENFPDDSYSKSRLEMVEAKLAEAGSAEQQRLQRMQEEQLTRQRAANLRQSAFNAYRSSSYDKAIADWREYLKIDPNSDEAYYYLGASYLEQKQLDTAILHFEKCVTLNPNHAPAHLNLGMLYDRHRDDLTQAAEHLRKAKGLGGTEKYSPDRLETMIQELAQRGQLDVIQKMAFPAEHKHAFSSCRGNIRITEGGVEFKTTEADHSFYEAYGDLRTFSVQGDDLSIRTRNNKKYNFHFLKPGTGLQIRRLAARYIQVTE